MIALKCCYQQENWSVMLVFGPTQQITGGNIGILNVWFFKISKYAAQISYLKHLSFQILSTHWGAYLDFVFFDDK